MPYIKWNDSQTNYTVWHGPSLGIAAMTAKGYERVDEKPFLFYRIYDERGNILRKTSTDDRVYVSPFRLEKVARFSYQRAFSESLPE